MIFALFGPRCLVLTLAGFPRSRAREDSHECDSKGMSRGGTCMGGKGSRIEQRFTDWISTEVTSQPLFCDEYWSLSGS